MKKNIINKTNYWLKLMTSSKKYNPNKYNPNKYNLKKIMNEFTDDCILWGTFSDVLCNKKSDINFEKYLNNFSNLPNLEVVNKKHNVNKITNDVYVNNSFVKWRWLHQDSIIARMTFIYRLENLDYKIFQLHSSVLPQPDILK